MRPPVILGHRGAPALARENTLESYRAALEAGADGFEFDVRRTADGKLVCTHGPRFGACFVSQSSLDRLCATRQGERLPLFSDVLREFGHAWLDIELKVPGIEAEVLELAAKYCRPGRHVLTCFARRVVARLRELDAQAPVGWLLRRPVRPASWRGLALSYLAPHYTALRPRLVGAARADGLPLITWTANSPRVIERALALGVEVIISDLPDLARQLVAARGRS